MEIYLNFLSIYLPTDPEPWLAAAARRWLKHIKSVLEMDHRTYFFSTACPSFIREAQNTNWKQDPGITVQQKGVQYILHVLHSADSWVYIQTARLAE